MVTNGDRTAIERIKEAIKIEDLIAETLTITGKGKVKSTAEHDSLKIFTDTNTWYQFSQGVGGDIFDWYQRIQGCDFRQTLTLLAERAGVDLAPADEAQRQAWIAYRQEAQVRTQILTLAANYYQAQLAKADGGAGLAYCLETRGWDNETIEREGIGYCPSVGVAGMAPLHRYLTEAGLLEHPLSRAVLSIPRGMIVYVYRYQGRVIYLSGRNIIGKKQHYKLPSELAGAAQIYHNHPTPKRLMAAGVLVEGPADAISLGMMGVEAVAIGGVENKKYVSGVRYVAFDNDAAGQSNTLDAALSIDPLARVVTWPATITHRVEGQGIIKVKDASDYCRGRVDAAALRAIFDNAPRAIEALAERAGAAQGDERKEWLQRFFSIYTGLDEIDATDMKPELAKHLCSGRMGQFNRLLKAYKEAKGEDEIPERLENSVAGARGGMVWEQCVIWSNDRVAQSMYAVRQPDGKVTMQPTVKVANTTYIPFSGLTELIEAEVVLFPEQPLEYGDEKQLVDDIRSFIHEYLDIDRFYEKLAAYYVLFTWVHDLFENLPYLRSLGDYGTGKTRFIQVIGACCYRPMFASGASTVSPIFNMIDIFGGTLVIDEADFANSDAEAEIIKILNVGYYKKGVVLRAEKDPNSKDDKYLPSAKKVFGPKILATRRPFTDRATESRCLTKRMTSARPRPGIPYTLGNEFWRKATVLRNKLLMYRLRNHKPVEIDQRLADESVEPRLNQVTLALKTIITDEEMRRDIDLFIRAYNQALINDRQMTLPALVVQALADLHCTPHVNVLGEDDRDFSMQGLAKTVQGLMNDIDPDFKVTAKRIGDVLREDLGLVRRKEGAYHRRSEVLYDEDELLALMLRFGIQPLQQK